jgi:hypothetical protein
LFRFLLGYRRFLLRFSFEYDLVYEYIVLANFFSLCRLYFADEALVEADLI